MFTEVFNLMRVIYYGVPVLTIIILLIISAVDSRRDKNTQIQKAGGNSDQKQSTDSQQYYDVEVFYGNKENLRTAAFALKCFCDGASACGSDLNESCQFFDPDEGRCKLRGCPGEWDV